MTHTLITLTSDFGLQSQGIGNMKGVIFGINPDAKVIDLMHGLPDFDIVAGARTLETVAFIPCGIHVCVVDPGVGTKRRAIIIKTRRGDYLVGPDNGVLIPALRMLGGFEKAVESTNKKYMNASVSHIFHGRDIFSPNAAYLSKGIDVKEFGKEIKFEDLTPAPYNDAEIKKNEKGQKEIAAEIIQINKFGSVHFNILHKEWDHFVQKGEIIELKFSENKKIILPNYDTFGEVREGKELIIKDDYGRLEAAINRGNISQKYSLRVGDKCIIRKPDQPSASS